MVASRRLRAILSFLFGRRELRAALLIGLSCLLVYNANRRTIGALDTYPARYLPFAIWRDHTVLLDPIATIAAQGRHVTTWWKVPPPGTAYWMVPASGGHVISLYSVALPVLIAPLYLPAVGYLQLQGWTDARIQHTARVMEKLTASLVAAVSASLLYLLLSRRAAAPIALLLTVAYAFGTTTWMIGSQALWQHGMGELLVIGALLLLTAPSTTLRAIAAGLVCGLIAANRPADVIIAAALGAYGLFWAGAGIIHRRPRRAALFAAAAALPIGLVLLYNLDVAGHIAGGYGSVGDATFFQHDLLSGLGGLLFSPTRGLFVFSPFLLFLALAWRHMPRDSNSNSNSDSINDTNRSERGLTLAMSAGIILQLLLYATTDWRAGISFGPRFLTDMLPMLMWLLVPVVVALRGVGRVCFMLAVAVAMVIEAIGAFYYTGASDQAIFAAATGPHQMEAAWDWRNAPFVASLRQGLAPAELTTVMRGNLDAIEIGGRATSSITAGEEVVAAGWALAGRATPPQVSVAIDGRQIASSRLFFDRPDVRAAIHEASPAGWRLSLDTTGLAPGEHTLAAYAWVSDNGQGYYLAQRKLTVRMASPTAAAAATNAGNAGDADLEDSFKIAAARIRAHQQQPGYWLTAYTSGTRFQQPHQEMNTYLTALLVDLLDPVASTAGLSDSLQRARQHLTSQIEDSGLVRYHGRPDAPTIGTLGCAITPDADDTALVWRIAPGPDIRQLTAALATINQYRTADGLYRTWLAPRAAYQCLDPGSDPDPADIAIQMHVLQLLAKVRPPAGRELCTALRHAVDQDRVWVYYRLAPLVPILRLTDLQHAGCTLELPESRMRTTIASQEIWISLVRLLGRWRTNADATEIHTVLQKLASQDFTLLRNSPPLLYHNDLTATTSRYYWSEDVGYALWLRLAHAYAHVGHSRLGH